MKIRIRQPQCFSEIGRKDNQEDFLWPLPGDVSAENNIFLMCDGVGGQDHGEVASRTAASAIGTYLSTHAREDRQITKALLAEALSCGYDALDRADADGKSKMATTMTCLALHAGGAMMAHIGDSRVYHVRPSLADRNGRTGIIYQSADHSLVNDLLRAGEITEEEAVNYPHKNVITRAMQPHAERRPKADVYNADDVQAGDYFFLCSDGVLEQLTNDALGQILADTSLDDTGKIKAIKAVCDGRTRDNYTCWLIPIDKVEGKTQNISDNEIVTAVVAPKEGTSTAEVPCKGSRPIAERLTCDYPRRKSAWKLTRKLVPGFPRLGWKDWTILILVLMLCISAAGWYFSIRKRGSILVVWNELKEKGSKVPVKQKKDAKCKDAQVIEVGKSDKDTSAVEKNKKDTCVQLCQ